MPKIAEFANTVLDLVAEELEVPKELILSKSRKAEVVDARHLAIRLLHSNNIYPSRIASIFGMSPRSVHYVITLYNTHTQPNRSLRNSFAKLAKQLGDNLEVTEK